MVEAHLDTQAAALVAAAQDLAARLGDGGLLVAAGSGLFASDAEHLSVEFIHPVIVGRRALPARPVAGMDRAALQLLGRRGGAVVSIGDEDGPAALVAAARDAGVLTIALGGSAPATHRIDLGPDRWTAKEQAVTAYHLLWELTHVFLDTGGEEGDGSDAGAGDIGAASALYPFLSSGRGSDPWADALDSTRRKLDEIAALRAAAEVTDGERLAACAAAVTARLDRGGTVFTCGNGGSRTDAASLAAALNDGPDGVGAFELAADRATVTALANDVGVELIFDRQLAALARGTDEVLVGLSTSGGSANVLRALDGARRRGMLTVGFAGYDGGEMARSGLVDHLFVVPSSSVHRIQEVQASLYLRLRGLVVGTGSAA